MCGITGILALTDNGQSSLNKIEQSVASLNQRGPDHQGIFRHKNLCLGHTRLSIIDTSEKANQPFTAKAGRYTITLNGEFYNFREHRETLKTEGVRFTSNSDTEIFLRLFMKEGPACLEKINGFFAVAIYDKKEDSLFIARDRIGIKPLLIYQDDNKLIWASEMKAITAFDIDKSLDTNSLFTYLQLNYIPAPYSIFSQVHKIQPGHYLTIEGVNTKPSISEECYYTVPYSQDRIIQSSPAAYKEAQKTLVTLLEESVGQRMVSDVPLGSFLSGGIDSSVVSMIAARHSKKLNTFSIGYKDHPYFDETEYAQAVAKKIGSKHTVYRLSNKDLLKGLHNVLEYGDEPFADSSAIAVNILSERAKKRVTVALSGDGADELFGGYNKHFAEFRARNPGVSEQLIKGLNPLWRVFPQSRSSKLADLNRKLARFAKGANLPPRERYWRWATFLTEEEANYMLKEERIEKVQRLSDAAHNYKGRKDALLRAITKEGDLNDVLYADTHMVLPDDMLRKVDTASMFNSMEVRTPFLDHRVVEFAFTLPVSFKINASVKKKILLDAFQHELPEELYNRPKQGFEVPLLQWFQSDLKKMITDDLLADSFVHEQGIFNTEAIVQLKKQLFSNNPGDSHATVWALIVFQYWWKKYMS